MNTLDIWESKNQKRGKRCINSGFIINGCRGVKAADILMEKYGISAEVIDLELFDRLTGIVSFVL